MATCYMLHFSRPISDKHTTKHYTGVALKSLAARLADHAAGRGARLTQVALDRGISWQVVATWEGGRKDERRFKNRKNAPRYCPICNGTAARKWREEKVIISHRGRQHSITTLPKWAQETIESLMRQRDEMRKVIDRLEAERANERLSPDELAAELLTGMSA